MMLHLLFRKYSVLLKFKKPRDVYKSAALTAVRKAKVIAGTAQAVFDGIVIQCRIFFKEEGGGAGDDRSGHGGAASFLVAVLSKSSFSGTGCNIGAGRDNIGF